MARKAVAPAVLQAVEVNGNTYVVPETLVGLADAINEQVGLVDQKEGTASGLLVQALEHSVIAGQLLAEARRRVKAEKKKGETGWMKWLETNFKGSSPTAHRYISLAENFSLVKNATSRAEALRIVDEAKKTALESGEHNAPVRGRPRKQIAAPATEEVVAPAASTSTNGNGHNSDYEDRAAHRAALAAEVNAIQATATSAAPVAHVVTVSPAPFVDDDNEAGPSEEELAGDAEIAEIIAEVEAEVAPAAVEVIVEAPVTVRFLFEGSPQQRVLQDLDVSLDRFEVELGPVTLNRAFDADLTQLTHLLTAVQCKLDNLLLRVENVVQDRKIRADLKAARQEGLV